MKFPGVRSRRDEVGAKHSENSLKQKLIIYRPNASPLQENSLKQKLIIYRPNASPLQESGLKPSFSGSFIIH
ncbi:hypothetical protein H5968_12875 [Sphaerospermopsis sp. LEGE 00249]|jgi:hypothetical protein|uniref:hypothetical protein n=1 Tax=Sphaerospermopsis sp. LEGE 00249 TaxID=1380707 RepID=UPI00164EAB83|nr:hypothetical protein [Sphaerospermopsis sp. LEGE 00249]MBC5796017.1 hypothetical protein [Sphaerospermopsis sp. LEGE 00249]